MAEVKNKSKAQREKQLADIARLYLRGTTQAEVGEQLGISQKQVSYDLKILRERWQESALIDFNEAKARELAKIDTLEVEYWQAWNDSKAEFRKTSITREGADAKTIKSARSDTEERNGDPRYLAGVQWCIEKRCAIIGINAPTKIAPTDPSGNKEYAGLTDDERISKLTAIFNAARARRDRQVSRKRND